MPKINVATFNCENLFARPRILMEPPAKAKALLAEVAKLQQELSKPVFDQPAIKALKTKLKGYITINDVRGKHDKAGIGADPAPPQHPWVGWGVFVRTDVTNAAIENTARVIADLDAAVLCLIETENRPVLQKFHDEVLYKEFLKPAGKSKYNHILLLDGNDERGIDVAVMSRLPVTALRTHIHETTQDFNRTVRTFSRDCLEADIQLPGNKRLTFMCNHFKSMGYSAGNDPQSNERRLGQSKRVAEIVDEHDAAQRYLIVAGDLNSDPASPSMAPLVNHPDLYNCNLKLPVDERGTHGSGKKQLDYLLLSSKLKPLLDDVRLERRGVWTKKWPIYPEVTSGATAASDHSAVVATLDV